METDEGPEPCAVLAVRGSGSQAAAAIESANARLAEFQRVRRWVLWPDPDLPRTSSGKVRRRAVAQWLSKTHASSSSNGNGNGTAGHQAVASFGASEDWLLALIAQISGESHPGVGDELRLTEDLHLDSLGRVQLAAAIEERLGIISEDGMLDRVETLGELRRLLATEVGEESTLPPSTPSPLQNHANGAPSELLRKPELPRQSPLPAVSPTEATPARSRHIYPQWPWLFPFHWARVAFIESVMRPLVWLLAAPRVVAPNVIDNTEPMLIVANHVTTFDAPLIEYALPGALRRKIAAAMSGEMLADYRHFLNPEPLHPNGRFFLPGPLFYYLLTSLFNVFPLPRRRDFQPSFAHAGLAMDRGYNVLVFPEGTRSAEGELAPFRPGIGLLAKQCGASVLPVAIRGLGDLKTSKRRWFRSGQIEIVVGKPVRLSPLESEAEITARLHHEVARLLESPKRILAFHKQNA